MQNYEALVINNLMELRGFDMVNKSTAEVHSFYKAKSRLHLNSKKSFT